MPHEDYYTLLGVTPSSSPEELTQAFHRLARQHHPDLNPGDSAADARFKEINEAYQTLSDPERRAQYDLELASAQSSQRFASSPLNTQDDQMLVFQRSVSVHGADFEAAVGDLTEALGGAASAVADELRGMLRDFATQLDQISRTARDSGGNRPRSRGYPPSRRQAGPPRGGRPPGKPPKR